MRRTRSERGPTHNLKLRDQAGAVRSNEQVHTIAANSRFRRKTFSRCMIAHSFGPEEKEWTR